MAVGLSTSASALMLQSFWKQVRQYSVFGSLVGRFQVQGFLVLGGPAPEALVTSGLFRYPGALEGIHEGSSVL